MANKKSIGLPGGPNEYITDISEYLSVEGYKFNSPDVDNPFNIIESGSITMEDVEFPVLGTDNLGNSQMMQPGMNYEFPGDQVFEIPMAQEGNVGQRVVDRSRSDNALMVNAANSFYNNMYSNDVNDANIKRLLFEQIRPEGYPSISGLAGAGWRDYFGKEGEPPVLDKDGSYSIDEEAWAKALGLPNDAKYFIPSEYMPSDAKNPNDKYVKLNPDVIDWNKLIKHMGDYDKGDDNKTEGKKKFVEGLSRFIKDDFMDADDFFGRDPLQGFQLQWGYDNERKEKYLSIYDKYDFRGVDTENIVKPFEIYDRIYVEENKDSGEYIPKAQKGNTETRKNIATIARENEEKEKDFTRPVITLGDYFRFWNKDEDGLCKDNTCVETVKQIYQQAGIDSIPENVYDNKTFLENYKDYGFTQITDEKDIQPGDVIQYYLDDNPYHMGINVYPGEYVSDGERNAPIQNKNMYVYENGDKKDPFRIFRYNKKYGGHLPKAEDGNLPGHLDPVDLSNLNEQNKQKINSSAYRDRLKKEYLNAHNIELDNEQLDGMVSDLNNQLTLGANKGNTGFYTQNVPDPSAAGFMFSGAGQIDAAGNQVSPRTAGYDYSNPTIGNIYIGRNASQKEPFTTINNEDGTSMEESIKQHEINHRLNSLSGSPLSSAKQSPLYNQSYDYHNSFFSNAPEDNPFNPNTKDKEFRDYATQPFEIKSQKAQLEQALLDAGIWDPSKGPFTQADVNKMVNSGISFNKGFDYLPAGLGINELVDGTVKEPGKLNNEMDYYSKYTNEKINDFLGNKGYENFSTYSSDPEMRDMRNTSQRPFERINKTLENTDQGSKKWNEWSEKRQEASNNYYNANADTRDLKEILDGEYDSPSKILDAAGIKVGSDGFYEDKDIAAIEDIYNRYKKTSDAYRLTLDDVSDDRPNEEGLFGAFGPLKNIKGRKAEKKALKDYNRIYGTDFKDWGDVEFENSEANVSQEDKNVRKNAAKYTGYGNIVNDLDRETEELNSVLRGTGGYDTKKDFYDNEFKLKGDYRPSRKSGRNEFNTELANNYMNDLKNDPNYDPKKDVFNNNFVPNNNFDNYSAWAYEPNAVELQEQNRKGFNTALKNNIWRDDLFTQAVLNLPARTRDSFIEYYNQDKDQRFVTKADIRNQRNLVRTLRENMPEVKNFIQNAKNNNDKFIDQSNQEYKIEQEKQLNNDLLKNTELNQKISPNLIKFMNEVAMDNINQDDPNESVMAQFGNNERRPQGQEGIELSKEERYIKNMKDALLYNANPLNKIDDILQFLQSPANLVRESIQGSTGKGDGEFNWGNIIPDIRNTNIFDEDKKQEYVSKTLGIDNPWGALATDLALDPATYVGVGALRSLAKKLGPKALKSFMKVTNKFNNIKPTVGPSSEVNFMDNVYKQQINDAPRIPGYELYNAKNPPRLEDLVNHYNKQSDDVTSVYRYGFDKDMPGGSWYSSDLGDPLRYKAYGRGDGVFKVDVPNNILKESYRGIVNNADAQAGKLPGFDPKYFQNSKTNFKEFRLSEGIPSVFADKEFGKKSIKEFTDYLRTLKKYGGDLPEAQSGLGQLRKLFTPIVKSKVGQKGIKYYNDLFGSSKNISKSFDVNNFDDLINLPDDEFAKFSDVSKDHWKLIQKRKPEYKDRLIKQYKGMFKPNDNVMPAIEKTQKEMASFFNSPEYKKRLVNGLNISTKEADDIVSNMIKQINETKFTFNNVGSDKYGALATGPLTKFDKAKITFTDVVNNTSPEQLDGLIRHELGHVGSYLKAGNNKLLSQQFPKLDLQERTIKTWSKNNKDLIDYYSTPDEIRQRGLVALDFIKKNNITIDDFLNISYDKIVTGKMQRKIPSEILDLRQYYKPEQLGPYLKKMFSVVGTLGLGDQLTKEQDGNGEAVMNNLDKVSAQRRDALNKAIETVVTSQGGSNDLSSILLMTSAMENSHGADSTAYENAETGEPRSYTRGMMSIDDIAYDDLYKPRGEKGKYSAKQLQNYKWLESLGLDYKNIDQKLRSNDPLANIATARLQYSRVTDPLPKSSDLDGMYNYYMKYYNKTDADHKDRFTQFYNELIGKEKEGGEPDMLSTYKNYINGKVKSQKAVDIYDKLNRIHLNDARRMGMTVPNYIMTHL